MVIPGGYAPDHIRRHAAANQFVRDMNAEGKLVASICHGPWVLCSADILKGRRATSFFAIKDDVVHAGAIFSDSEVVVDGNLVTSRKPEDLPAFCRASIRVFIQRRPCSPNRVEQVIHVRDLQKSYGDVRAVRGIDFEVAPGEVFGLLGPNGAGKTTTVEILEGLRPRTSGDVKVLGYDPAVQVKDLKDRIGVCLQSTNLPDKITVREALALFQSFYSRSTDIDSLIDRLQLSEKRNAYYQTLSGGQKQRVALALALVNDPQLVFLDEPTTGLDPQVRLEIHSLIGELRDAKRTILITTHYIEEAERLCDRVAIIDQGKIIALGTPREIQARTLGTSLVEIRTTQPMPLDVPDFEYAGKFTISEDRKLLNVHSAKPARTLPDLLKWIDQNGLELEDIHLKRPTLEDVFIELTGKRLRE